MDKGVLTSLQFIDYKLITVSIFKELEPIEINDVRSLADPHNSYFFDRFCFVGAQ